MTAAGAGRSRRGVYLHTIAAMGTVVTIQVVQKDEAPGRASDSEAAVDRALDWFRQVEACCSRFDARSEVSRLAGTVGVAVPVSDMLFEAVRFALAVAADSGGAFDPTVGHTMAARGFNRHYQTGEIIDAATGADRQARYTDVELDTGRRTITLHRSLMLDLGAVAKGLAIDMAARELQPFGDFAIDAGGDLYFAGRNVDGQLWVAGIRHPRDPARLLATVRLSDAALCTSGDYERRVEPGGGHHLMDARTGASADRTASATVMAPTAMAADAFATAAFVLGPDEGIRWLQRQDVEGLIVSPALECRTTPGFGAQVAWL